MGGHSSVVPSNNTARVGKNYGTSNPAAPAPEETKNGKRSNSTQSGRCARTKRKARGGAEGAPEKVDPMYLTATPPGYLPYKRGKGILYAFLRLSLCVMPCLERGRDGGKASKRWTERGGYHTPKRLLTKFNSIQGKTERRSS